MVDDPKLAHEPEVKEMQIPIIKMYFNVKDCRVLALGGILV